MQGGQGADIVGPANPALRAQEPFTTMPPDTGHGATPNLNWDAGPHHARHRHA